MNNLTSILKIEHIRYIIKNTGRKKKQTCFTLLCIGVASFTVLAHISLNNGVQEALKRNVNEAISGQLMVYSSDYDKLNIMEAQLKEQNTFFWSKEDTEQFCSLNSNFRINQRVRFGAMVAFEEETSYICFHALENDHLERISKILSLKEGEMPSQMNHILISESMLNDLKCQPGDTILLLADNMNGYMSDEIGIISGVFEEKGIAVFFGYNGFLPYEYGKEIVQVDEERCLEFIINPVYTEEFSRQEIAEFKQYIQANHPELKMASWEKTIPLFYKIANIWGGCGKINTVIFLIFSLIILTTLTTLIIQSRKRELGTLLTLGFNWRKVTTMLCLEYLLLSFIATFLGFFFLQIFISTLPATGVILPSKELQSALMTEKIIFFLQPVNILTVWVLFSLTTLTAVVISLNKIKKEKLSILVKTQ